MNKILYNMCNEQSDPSDVNDPNNCVSGCSVNCGCAPEVEAQYD